MLEQINQENFHQMLNRFSTPELESMIEKFPYFQQAHLLLAKKYQEENSPKFDQQLQLAALYMQDRELLYNLFNEKAAKSITETKTSSPVFMEVPVIKSEETITVVQPVIAEPVEEQATKEKERTAQIGVQETLPEEEKSLAQDLADIENSAKELNQFLDQPLPEFNEPEVVEEKSLAVSEIGIELPSVIEETTTPASIDPILPAEEFEPVVIQNEVIDEYKEEDVVEEEEEAPIEPPVEKFSRIEPHTFDEWLKAFNNKSLVTGAAKPSKIEEEEEKAEEEEADDEDELNKLLAVNVSVDYLHDLVKEETTYAKGLERFIEEQIQKHKQPETKKVVVETDLNAEPATETMAKVYEMQKKYAKAIKTYEALNLKFPERSSFFNSRINYLKTII